MVHRIGRVVITIPEKKRLIERFLFLRFKKKPESMAAALNMAGWQ
jgi:hypothetical protein